MSDGSIHIDTKLDSSSLKPQLDSMKKSIGDSFASMRDVMQGPVMAVQMLSRAISGIGDATVGQAAKIEDMVAAFTPMVGGAENAKVMIAALNKEAATTPYELEGIGSVAKQLLPVLGNNVGKVTETFRMLGDTAGGNIQKLDTITRGYMKSILKGKVDMESLNMISEAGVPIYSELSKSMGVSTTKMMDMSSKGTITGDMLTAAFKSMTSEGGIFFNGMNVASQTLNGKLSTLSDNVKQAGGAIGDAFLPMTKAMVDGINAVLGGFVSWASSSKLLKDILPPLIIGVTAGIIALGVAALVSSGAFAALGAAMAAAWASGTLGLSILITAVVAGIVLMATHWNQTVLLFDETIANISMWFSVAWSSIKEGAIVAFNGAKVSALSLAKIILDSVLGAVTKLLDVMGKMPFVGEQFKAASAAVKGFQNGIDASIDSAKAESAAAINAADDTRKAEQKSAKDRLALAKKSFNERQALIDAEGNKKPATDQTAPMTTAPTITSTFTDSELKTRNEWLDKAKQAYIDNLEEEETAALDSAKTRNASVAEQVAIAKEYDDKEYAAYKEMLDGKEAADLNGVTDAATITAIKESYEHDLTEYKKKQENDRNDIEKEANDKRIAYDEQWANKNKKTLEQQKYEEIAYAESIGASSESIANIISEYNNKIKQEIANTWQSAISLAGNALSAFADESSSQIANLTSAASSVVSLIASGGLDISSWSSLISSVGSIAKESNISGIDELEEKIDTMVDYIVSAISPLIEDLINGLGPLVDIFINLISAISPLINLVAYLTETLNAPLVAALNAIINIVVNLVSGIVTILIGLYNNVAVPVYNFFMQIFNKLYNGIAGILNKVIDVLNSINILGWQPFNIGHIATRGDDQGTLSTVSYSASVPTSSTDNKDYTGDLKDANKELANNKNLFTQASKAADAYSAVMKSLVSTVSSFYDGLKDIGSDIGTTIIDSLLDGLDNDDFMYALEEYITKAIVKAAVYTDSFTASLSGIATKLAQAISTGDTGAIESLKNQLSTLYTSAQATANSVTAAVSSAFGSYAVGSAGLPSDGLIYAHQGEAVIPAGLMSEAARAGLTIAPTASLLSGTNNISLSQSFQLVVDGKAMAATVYKYQDELVGAAYGA